MNKSPKNSKARIIISCLLVCIIIAACKDKNNDVETGTTFPDELQGVWQDESFDDGEIGIIIESKTVSSWDYLGDEYDEGEDCYEIGIIAELISYEGDHYTLNVMDLGDEPEEESGTITIEDDLLVLQGDEEDEKVVYSRTGLSKSDLAPGCDESTAKANKNHTFKTFFESLKL